VKAVVRARPRRRAHLVAAGVALSLLGVALAELAARRLAPVTAEEQHETELLQYTLNFLQPCARVEGDGWRETPRRIDPSRPPPPGRLLTARPPPGVSRVIVVGESSAWLLASGMQRAVAASPCGARVEVWNCGVPAGAPELVELRVREAYRYAPDALVLLFGHNLHYRFVPQTEAAVRMQIARSRSRLLTLAAQRWARRSPDRPPPAEADAQGRPVRGRTQAGRTDADIGRTARMLTRVADEARRRGVPMVMSTMPSNRWMPPTVRDEDRVDPRFLEARYLRARGRREAARAALSALAGQREVALDAYTLGDWALEDGDAAGARAWLDRAITLSPSLARAPDALNDVVRQVARRASLPLRDLAADLAVSAPEGTPSWESFSDNCHLLPAANDREALRFLDLAREVARPGSAGLCPVTARPDPPIHPTAMLVTLASSLARESDRGEHIPWDLVLTSMVARMLRIDPGYDQAVTFFLEGDPPSLREARTRDRVVTAIAAGYRRAGNVSRAEALEARVLRDDGWVGAWVQSALGRLAAGDTVGASQRLSRALTRDADDPSARFFARRLAADVP
jgi:hypothetical protein